MPEIFTGFVRNELNFFDVQYCIGPELWQISRKRIIESFNEKKNGMKAVLSKLDA